MCSLAGLKYSSFLNQQTLPAVQPVGFRKITLRKDTDRKKIKQQDKVVGGKNKK